MSLGILYYGDGDIRIRMSDYRGDELQRFHIRHVIHDISSLKLKYASLIGPPEGGPILFLL